MYMIFKIIGSAFILTYPMTRLIDKGNNIEPTTYNLLLALGIVGLLLIVFTDAYRRRQRKRLQE